MDGVGASHRLAWHRCLAVDASQQADETRVFVSFLPWNRIDYARSATSCGRRQAIGSWCNAQQFNLHPRRVCSPDPTRGGKVFNWSVLHYLWSLAGDLLRLCIGCTDSTMRAWPLQDPGYSRHWSAQAQRCLRYKSIGIRPAPSRCWVHRHGLTDESLKLELGCINARQ